jgi:Reverse transcriptase (RNA-dependent DNA polymerase)
VPERSRLTDLHARVHSGAYRASPSRRKYIPKADGKQRPLGIAALEDKIVQAAVVAILTPIYEAEFLGFSYGFRPGRGQHDALDVSPRVDEWRTLATRYSGVLVIASLLSARIEIQAGTAPQDSVAR